MNIFKILLIIGLKIFDNILLTYKSIVTYQGKKILSSIIIIISQFMFYTIIKEVMLDESLVIIIIISFASGIGNWFAFIINDKFKKDDTWQNILTTSDNEDMIRLCNVLKKHKIKYLLFNTRNRRNEESLTAMIFAKTKAESKLIDNYLEFTEAKYLRMINGIEVKTQENKNY